MNKNLLFCLMSLALAASAQAGNLLPPGSADQSPTKLMAAPVPTGKFERQPLSFAWALDPQAGLEASAPHLAESREFWAMADGAELKRGFDIQTTAPGAVIRISPAAGNTAVDPGSVRVMKNGRMIPEPQSFQRKANARQLRAAGMDVPEGSAIVQIAAAHGQGRFQVALPKASGRYLYGTCTNPRAPTCSRRRRRAAIGWRATRWKSPRRCSAVGPAWPAARSRANWCRRPGAATRCPSATARRDWRCRRMPGTSRACGKYNSSPARWSGKHGAA
ncbi:DUF4785 domain-containing protein [Arenimonas daejeonensis]|uniref:DUF4785 domain-containing protein n=1 Tax=Arenimonas daejeonensis TaxID=370777 RepID=UPI0011BDD6A2|nr:DUF4785 domain-containing protein [Arenimonas daejeonensis]